MDSISKYEENQQYYENLDKRTKEYKSYAEWKANQEADSKGLGDTVEKITEATGIKAAVKFLAGEDCGCDERKETLNKLFSYRKPNCLLEDEYEFLSEIFSRGRSVIGGLEKKNKIITSDEKKVIAFHEAGHAATSWLLEHAAPLVKVTIVPRGRSLGAAWYLPEERQITTSEQMLDEMCATMGGRAAEKVVFGKISTGALSDLEKVTKQARAMVTVYGLNDQLGNVTYYDSQGQSEYQMDKPYSEETAVVIDKEISKIIEGQYDRAVEILEQNREKLDELAQILLEKEVIFKENVEEIFGKRPWDKLEETVEAEVVEEVTEPAVEEAIIAPEAETYSEESAETKD